MLNCYSRKKKVTKLYLTGALECVAYNFDYMFQSECEAPGIKGEEKYCATSLEKMIEFTTSRLGKKVKALSTDVEKESEMQKYRILGSEKLGEKVVVCHKQNYAYAVFYCHKTNNVKAYTVFLVGNDETKAKAALICHTDTSSWNPKHLALHIV